jgi:hypothetical protein
MSNSDNPPRRGASNLREDPELLRGVLASEAEVKFYPEDSCLMCEREGKLAADEKCFHRHWATADAQDSREYRGHGVR